MITKKELKEWLENNTDSDDTEIRVYGHSAGIFNEIYEIFVSDEKARAGQLPKSNHLILIDAG